MKTWRDYVEKNGKRSIPHRIAGYACLDGEKIVAISYLSLPKKFSIRYFHKLWRDRRFDISSICGGIVVKKKYQRRGIAWNLQVLKLDLARKMGYKRYRSRVDINNIASLKLFEKMGARIVKRTNKKIYFVTNLVDECDRKDRNNQ